jgi:hypothetical protein
MPAHIEAPENLQQQQQVALLLCASFINTTMDSVTPLRSAQAEGEAERVAEPVANSFVDLTTFVGFLDDSSSLSAEIPSHDLITSDGVPKRGVGRGPAESWPSQVDFRAFGLPDCLNALPCSRSRSLQLICVVDCLGTQPRWPPLLAVLRCHASSGTQRTPLFCLFFPKLPNTAT